MSRDLIVIGASWGGLDALRRLLASVPDELDVPIAIAQHRAAGSPERGLESVLQRAISRPVRDVADKDPIERSHVFVAPPDYHLLVERGSFALSTDARVRYARPSIDVLFESAADAYGEGVIGVVLTGSNDDGAAGLRLIVARGGVAIVQDPDTAERRELPDAALAAVPQAAVLALDEIGLYLATVCFAGSSA